MTPVTLSLISIAAVSFISLIGAITISWREATVRRILFVLVGISVGALLASAFFHLIPEASIYLPGKKIGMWILLGMLGFFILEKFLHWHHHHEAHPPGGVMCEDCDEHIAPFGRLIIFSDVLHNFLDGAIITAAYLVSFEVGIAATVAVALHELPQEIGDFGVLLHAGFSRGKALIANFASSLSAFVGAGAVLLLGASFNSAAPVLSALAAGGFIYIAAADLVPELQKTFRFRESVMQLVAVIVGVVLVFMVGIFEAEHEEPPTIAFSLTTLETV